MLSSGGLPSSKRLSSSSQFNGWFGFGADVLPPERCWLEASSSSPPHGSACPPFSLRFWNQLEIAEMTTTASITQTCVSTAAKKPPGTTPSVMEASSLTRKIQLD